MNICCPICNHINKDFKKAYPYQTTFNNLEYFFCSCQKCKSVFVQNYPDELELENIYKKDNYHNKFYYKKNYEKKNNVEEIFGISKNVKKICDFGCGDGEFLNSLPNSLEKFGVEFSKELVQELEFNNEDIKFFDTISFFKNKNINSFFDIIYVRDVLEHLTNPYQIMENLIKYLSKDGLLIIEGPIEENYNIIYYFSKLIGFLKHIFKIKNYFTPYHITRTNHYSQKLFFKRLNDVKIYSYTSFETGWPYKHNGILRNLISNINFIFFYKKNIKFNNRFVCTLKKL